MKTPLQHDSTLDSFQKFLLAVTEGTVLLLVLGTPVVGQQG